MEEKKVTRLKFSKNELTDEKTRRAAAKAERAAEKAEAAQSKLPKKTKLRLIRKAAGEKSPGGKLRSETKAAEAARGKLRIEKVETTAGRPKTGAQAVRNLAHGAVVGALNGARNSVDAEDDGNAGTQALESGTSAAQGGGAAASNARYSRKLKTYEKAERLVEKSDQANVEALYRKARQDNPEPPSNPISRWRQKQEIKKEYAAAKRAGSAASSTASGASGAARGTEKAAKETKSLTEKAMDFVKKHPKGILIVIGLGFLVMVIGGTVSSCSVMFSGGGQVVLETSFTAEDEDILGSEADYTAMEAALRSRIERLAASDDYDEVRLNVDEIGHNPWKLAALLTVLYEDYTREEVQDFLEQLFAAQYELTTATSTETVTETRTVRVGESLGIVTTSGYCNCSICCGIWAGGPTASGVYPTANHTIAVDASNPFVPIGTKVIMNGVEYTVEDTGNFAQYGVQFDVYYDDHQTALAHGHQKWECYLADDNGSNSVEVTTTSTITVLTVTAVNHTLESVIASLGLTEEQMERYTLLLETQGNKPYLFEDDVYASSTDEYLDYDIPGEALTDEKFANMIREAEKYLGYPYVWGGSSPSTSFDCSGFVSWVINNCGNGWSVGRLTANGLMGICDIIPASEAKPGDLIFFQGTYDTSGASHVGIYVGNGMMIHCGAPISYASIETTYWQQHFYCFGRIRG